MVIDLGKASHAAQSIYDLTYGSGSLLLKAHDEAKSRTSLDLALYRQGDGQRHCGACMHKHGAARLPDGRNLAGQLPLAPALQERRRQSQDLRLRGGQPAVSVKSWMTGFDPANDLHGRFEYGIPPAKNGDYAFLLHMLKSLKNTGKAAVVLPHGVLFRGGTEAAIRTRIIKQCFIKGIIGLPANLFYGTGIPACILMLDKEGAAGRAFGNSGIFMIDGSRGFINDGNKNRLRAQDIHKIVDTFTRQLEIPRYSRLAPLAEIETNCFNLNLPRYIDSTSPEDMQDIEAHLKGGIPNADIDGLAPYWQVFPGVRRALFAAADRPGYSQPRIEASQVKAAIFGHVEFAAFNQTVTALFGAWKATSTPLLTDIKPGDRPNALIETLAESLLETFRSSDASPP